MTDISENHTALAVMVMVSYARIKSLKKYENKKILHFAKTEQRMIFTMKGIKTLLLFGSLKAKHA